MLVLRPIRGDDFAALKQIAIESGHGFTSLPVDDELLQAKIERSERSVEKHVNGPGDEGYLFVLQDTESGDIVGTTGIEAAVGMSVPLYHYRRSTSVHHSPSLDVYNRVDTLSMCNDYTGCSEICTLFLREPYRRGLTGRFLSRIRFLFMAEHSDRFSDTIIAEMRGVSDEHGHSPFWQWLQQHFFSIEFPQADHLVGLGDKTFISELMPKYPIYVNLLSEAAQAVIGQVHDNTKPALRLLQREGFEHRGYVDLFDAGPTVEAKLGNISTVRQSKVCPILIKEQLEPQATTWALCNDKVGDFRAIFSDAVEYCDIKHQLYISAEAADTLGVSQGDSVRFFALSSR
ncbi:arginine N-succinyltransferase [Pseudoalteromonas sp. SW0106-04]|uniref:arginine N-succinyltransferase n=1 Tax=Pseudoalteromonas sp. SW0106-04 TaxID=1702169 RepID=UPI0006B62994|nr:arginine N-succinyltransferase [Pseudoalteromonas sp. SW0106-04]GAP73584.1 arginine N-succinyltransferase [Pseudoalteromonas sp. SW0106-04]